MTEFRRAKLPRSGDKKDANNYQDDPGVIRGAVDGADEIKQAGNMPVSTNVSAARTNAGTSL